MSVPFVPPHILHPERRRYKQLWAELNLTHNIQSHVQSNFKWISNPFCRNWWLAFSQNLLLIFLSEFICDQFSVIKKIFNIKTCSSNVISIVATKWREIIPLFSKYIMSCYLFSYLNPDNISVAWLKYKVIK